ncbi:MAG TPA: antibiotic biosynthesis monooxygenase family protein [Acidimicrobiales bacterium]|jgi:quinol monooxygenase YgiN|nr:antibiotic biosynthesis monooxygenase family protein [Acidimicrobiales bacterium]
MSVHVTTELKTKPEHTEDVVAALSEALPHSLDHDGCEAIHLRRDQDDPSRIVSFTQWANRRDYENYLAWRTETGMTDNIEEMLTEPLNIDYFDDILSLTR